MAEVGLAASFYTIPSQAINAFQTAQGAFLKTDTEIIK
jgi:hypothetical protein